MAASLKQAVAVFTEVIAFSNQSLDPAVQVLSNRFVAAYIEGLRAVLQHAFHFDQGKFSIMNAP